MDKNILPPSKGVTHAKMNGIFLNIDINTVTFPFLQRIAAKEAVTEEDLFPFVDQYTGSAVTDVAINVFCQISMTPSQVWSDVLDSYHRKEENGQAVNYEEILWHYHRLYEELGIDVHAVWFARLRELGLRSYLSVRMNDCHCPDMTAVWIRGSEFYEADEKGWKLGERFRYQRHCFDYANAEFRARMLAYIEEQLLRYDVDGLELDFSREWYCFDPQKTPDCARIMTKFVREVRSVTKRAEEKWGHPVLIHFRAMRDIGGNEALGFDVLTMANEGLVDSVSVAPRWGTCDSDMPIEDWKTALPVPVYAGITDLTWLVPTDEATAAAYASAYLARGADKIYLYNFFTDPDKPSDAYVRLRNVCGSRETLKDVPKRFVVTRQDMVVGDSFWSPLPAQADGFSLPLVTGPIGKTQSLVLVLGFDREITQSEVTVTLGGVPATLLGRTEHGEAYAEGATRYAGVPMGKVRYAYALPVGAVGERPTLRLFASDGVTVSYIELVIGTEVPYKISEKETPI